ncbi:amino acid kinase [Aureimonas populi]|uniref:Amino acid kinase n=1 Tax=Aureimonas populi TaxID=1701758 RepID=A0ABW5CRD4_9HYPH|nr:amino acid kinase [Aureimonas populi]
MDDILIVKFGGSSISPPDLVRWVRAMEESQRPLILVPGGGPFADVVRDYQAQVGYDDDAAHHMAILAMEQFGRALVSLGEKLVPVATQEAIGKALDDGLVPVWMPAKLVLQAGEIHHDWSTTSDSLAAWLAGRYPGASLCLIKQIDLPEGRDLDAVSAAGVVDPSFVRQLHPATRVFIAGPSDLAMAGRRLAGGTVPGREVTPAHRPEECDLFEAAQ